MQSVGKCDILSLFISPNKWLHGFGHQSGRPLLYSCKPQNKIRTRIIWTQTGFSVVHQHFISQFLLSPEVVLLIGYKLRTDSALRLLKTSTFLSSNNLLMGRNNREIEMRKETHEDYQQEQSEAEPSSDTDEDQMTIHRLVASKRKRITSDQESGKGTCQITRRKLNESRMVSHHNNQVPLSVVLERAEEIRANLDHRYPSFGKIMLRSHVTRGFWMGFPSDFCRDHMPKHNDVYILEDEDGEEYQTNFLASRMGFSKGWRGFTISHKLLEGDVVLFQMIESKKFKVFIVRSNSLEEAEGATVRLPQLEGNINGKDCGGEVCGDDDAGAREKSAAFVDFQDFNIIFNGAVLDFVIPDMRLKYYELCHAQNSCLHEGLLNTISCSSAIDIISDTVEIASAIRSSTASTPSSLFALWDQTLAAFEMLGVKVGFLRARVKKLVALAKQVKDTTHAKRYKQATAEYNRKEEEARTLEAKLLDVQQEKMELHCEMETLNKHIRMDESRFLEEAEASW